MQGMIPALPSILFLILTSMFSHHPEKNNRIRHYKRIIFDVVAFIKIKIGKCLNIRCIFIHFSIL